MCTNNSIYYVKVHKKKTIYYVQVHKQSDLLCSGLQTIRFTMLRCANNPIYYAKVHKQPVLKYLLSSISPTTSTKVFPYRYTFPVYRKSLKVKTVVSDDTKIYRL